MLPYVMNGLATSVFTLTADGPPQGLRIPVGSRTGVAPGASAPLFRDV
ncbi:hypothetical protein [Streptomyces atratus]